MQDCRSAAVSDQELLRLPCQPVTSLSGYRLPSDRQLHLSPSRQRLPKPWARSASSTQAVGQPRLAKRRFLRMRGQCGNATRWRIVILGEPANPRTALCHDRQAPRFAWYQRVNRRIPSRSAWRNHPRAHAMPASTATPSQHCPCWIGRAIRATGGLCRPVRIPQWIFDLPAPNKPRKRQPPPHPLPGAFESTIQQLWLEFAALEEVPQKPTHSTDWR